MQSLKHNEEKSELLVLGSSEGCPELGPELLDLLGKSTLKKNKREHLNTQRLFHSVRRLEEKERELTASISSNKSFS